MSDFEDRFAIRELIDRYSDAVNHRDWAALETCFTEDGVWDVGAPFSFKIESAKAIVATCSEKMATTVYVVQTPHATVIKLDGNKATARSTMYEAFRFEDGTGGEFLGTYSDDIVRDAKGWRFKRRTYRTANFNPAPPVGQVFAASTN